MPPVQSLAAERPLISSSDTGGKSVVFPQPAVWKHGDGTLAVADGSSFLFITGTAVMSNDL